MHPCVILRHNKIFSVLSPLPTFPSWFTCFQCIHWSSQHFKPQSNFFVFFVFSFFLISPLYAVWTTTLCCMHDDFVWLSIFHFHSFSADSMQSTSKQEWDGKRKMANNRRRASERERKRERGSWEKHIIYAVYVSKYLLLLQRLSARLKRIAEEEWEEKF